MHGLDPKFLIKCVEQSQRADTLRGGGRNYSYEAKTEEQLKALKVLSIWPKFVLINGRTYERLPAD